MITTFFMYMVTFILGTIATISSSIFAQLPAGFNDAIAYAMGGAKPLNAILPMWPHPEMNGLAAETGFMPLFGWLTLLLSAVVFVFLVFKLIKFGMRFLPWNTEE